MGFDAKSFLAFFILVSEKLDTKLSDNLLKKHFFGGILVVSVGERMVSKQLSL
ncbi:hypothetical protein N199_01335 [Helicobacter pylori UM038]|uniref:Uncharacterized protein n=1 Tax=Helicobacter pylori UM038 TaxID=1352343 RepID=A0AAV3JS59_HELPX|nr:hypothetical protein N199_01335 [Helicobacter pylori UM038]